MIEVTERCDASFYYCVSQVSMQLLSAWTTFGPRCVDKASGSILPFSCVIDQSRRMTRRF